MIFKSQRETVLFKFSCSFSVSVHRCREERLRMLFAQTSCVLHRITRCIQHESSLFKKWKFSFSKNNDRCCCHGRSLLKYSGSMFQTWIHHAFCIETRCFQESRSMLLALLQAVLVIDNRTACHRSTLFLQSLSIKASSMDIFWPKMGLNGSTIDPVFDIVDRSPKGSLIIALCATDSVLHLPFRASAYDP